MPADALGRGAGVPDMMQWPMAGAPNNVSMLADAYGASHGQPQSGMGGMNWFNGANPLAMGDLNQASFGMPLMGGGPAGMPNVPQLSTAQLAQQLNALHLQNQQNEQILMQQNKLLAQIQAAQELRAQAELEASTAQQQQQQQNNPLLQFAQSHQIPTDLPTNRRHAISSRPKHSSEQVPPRSHSPNPARASAPQGNRFSSGSGSPSINLPSGGQLPPDLSKALSAMNAIRQSTSDAHYDTPDSSFSQSPRPSSYSGRDRNRESGSWAQNPRSDARRTSAVQRSERAPEFHTPDRAQASPPSIIIDRAEMESSTLSPLPPSIPVDVNSVGMRIGQRIVPGVNAESSAGTTLPSTPNSRPDKRHSYSELGANKSGGARGPEQVSPRPLSMSAATQTPLIQPRRQPRGPPTESFFANNFLARRSLRTRREAMSKLCASPRAASFSGPKPNAQAVSSPLARQS
ncbi:hypothetical protein CBS9595_003981 [Malassezia furfur]|nr:hypothetical protein CBS9595_003981 [Malassezia furfur]